jgi:hypothetical protein
MENDIEPILELDKPSINISKIGKYDRFVEFTKYHDKTLDINDIQFRKPPFLFHTDNQTAFSLNESDKFLAMARMQIAAEKNIEAELKQDQKLQDKIRKIELKTAKKIEKLKHKPTEKLKKKYNYHLFEHYFMPLTKDQ